MTKKQRVTYVDVSKAYPNAMSKLLKNSLYGRITKPLTPEQMKQLLNYKYGKIRGA